jgi:uncharacterized protein DUF4157
MGWWFIRSRARESEAEADAAPLPETESTHPGADRVLDLQRIVGNQAVQGILARSRAPGSAKGNRAGHEPLVPKADTGETLEPEVRRQMESRLGEDLGGVHVHTSEEAARSAEALGAEAFTVGHDIYFARSRYAPTNPPGRRLLAHELAHVVQQGQADHDERSELEVSEPTDATEREADSVATAVERDHRAPDIAQAGRGIQRDVGWARRGPLPDPYGELLLLNAFAVKFLDAAKLIRGNPAAMKLVDEAQAAGVEFGGFAEDGPGKALGRAYTSGRAVYVPKAQSDPVMAMRDFLFELNNALRAPQFAELHKEAVKGSQGSLSARQYAYRSVELEVEGMLRLGEIWFETKRTMPRDAQTAAHDAPYFLPDYEAVRSGGKTKDALVREVLQRVYETGVVRGKTVETYYMEAYQRLSGGR